MEKEKQNSLMTKAAIVLMILILPFNIIGIITSVLSYRASLKIRKLPSLIPWTPMDFCWTTGSGTQILCSMN